MSGSTQWADFLSWQQTASPYVRVAIVAAVTLGAFALQSISWRLPGWVRATVHAISMAFGVAACQWTYPAVIVGVERFFEGSWVIGKTHHAGTPLMVWVVGGLVALAEYFCIAMFAKRADVDVLRRLPRLGSFAGYVTLLLCIWATKALLQWSLSLIGVYAPMVPPPVNVTGWFRGVYSVGYCIMWAWLIRTSWKEGW